MIYLLETTTRYQDGDESHWKSFMSEEGAMEYASKLANGSREQLVFCLFAVDAVQQIQLEVTEDKVEVRKEIVTKKVRRKVPK